jgi:hypothetical protein
MRNKNIGISRLYDNLDTTRAKDDLDLNGNLSRICEISMAGRICAPHDAAEFARIRNLIVKAL